MENQEQLPPDSFEAQIQRLDGVISIYNSTGVTLATATNSTTIPRSGFPGYNTWIDTAGTQWVTIDDVLEKSTPEPIAVPRKKNIFDLLKLTRDENNDNCTTNDSGNVLAHDIKAQD